MNAWAAGIKADGLGHGLLAHQGRWLSAGTDKQHQTKTLYVMNVEGKRTTGPLLIGLLDYIQRWLPNVGYFEVRPSHFLAFPPDVDSVQSISCSSWHRKVAASIICMDDSENALEIGCKLVRVYLQTTADSMPMHNAKPNDCKQAMLLQVGAFHSEQCRRAT